MRILHLVRSIDDRRALATATAHAAEHEVVVVLLHDAVLDRAEFPGSVFACDEDARARWQACQREVLDCDQIVGKILEADRVICW